MRSLNERLQAFEQKKAKLADLEAKLKLAERQSQLRRCIRIGELAMKAGLGELSDEAMFGAMLSLAREDEAKQRRWAAEGVAALTVPTRTSDDREPILLTFPAYPPADVVVALRAQGFRFNRLLRHWEGLAELGDAEVLAEAHGGIARRVSA